jgi:hypothetical protein
MGEIGKRANKEKDFQEKLIKFLQGEDEEPREPPIAVPPTFQDFPSTTPESELYQQLAESAKEFLDATPVKPYFDVQPNEAPHTFTIKRLRSFDNQFAILTALKNAIIPTFDNDTEAAAWAEYYSSAVHLLRGFDIEMGPGLRNDLIISFRQARQNAYGKAVTKLGDEDDRIVGFEIIADNSNTRYIHSLWHGIALAKDDPRWTRVRPPSDFGCDCHIELVMDAEKLSPEFDIPELFPGESYRFYAQPQEREPEIQ